MKKLHLLFIILIILILINIAVYENQKPQKTDIKEIKEITGSATGNAPVSFRIISLCNIYLKEGWNLISICANMTNRSVGSALNDIDGHYRYVMEWNESSQSFLIYSPLAAENPFDELSENRSYFVYLTGTQGEINAVGSLFEDMEILLSFGWNSPIYPYEFDTPVTDYLDSINKSYRYMMIWNSSSQEFMIFSPLAASNEFTNIGGGQGQFIYISNESGATIKYNRSELE